MSDDRRAIALQALRAAGHDQAAELVAAIIPEPVVAPAATTPVQVAPAPGTVDPAAVPPQVAALASTPGPQPPGKAPLQTIEDWEALPDKDQLARMNELDALIESGAK